MVLDSSVEIGAIVAYVAGIGSKLAFDEYTRRRDRREEAKQERIQWYEDVSSLAKEMKLVVPFKRRNLEYFNEDMNLGQKSLGDVLSEEEMRFVRQEYEKQGWAEEEAEAVMEELALKEWEEKRDAAQEEMQMDMRMFEERLRELISRYPDDVEGELLQELGTLLWRLDAVGTIGRFFEDERIDPVVESVIERCSSAIDELE
jgi:hypothetical protein